MSSRFLQELKILSLVTLILFGINSAIGYQFGISFTFLLTTYLFFFLLNCIILYIFEWVAKKYIDKSGFVFISFMFLKALLITIFLLIANNSYTLSKMLMLNFALIYLTYLFYSMHACLKTLNFYQK